MTLTPSMVYLAGIADSLRAMLCILTVVNLVVAAMSLMLLSDGEVLGKAYKKAATCAACFAAVFGLLMALTPSTKTIAAMYVLPAVVNSEIVQKLPAEATGLALEWLKELRKERKK